MKEKPRQKKAEKFTKVQILSPGAFHLCGCGHEGMSDNNNEETLKPEE